MLYSKCAKTCKICKTQNSDLEYINTIVCAVYNSLKYLFDSVVGIEYIYKCQE